MWFSGKLELHEADLLKEGSFDAAVKGAHFVFHTASPFFRCVSVLRSHALALVLLVLRVRGGA